MPVFHTETPRNVVPRWRDFDTTVTLGELTSSTSKEQSAPFESSPPLDQISDWNATQQLSFAGDLVSAAIVSGVPGSAAEAANFVLQSEGASASLKRLAALVFAGPRQTDINQVGAVNHDNPSVEPVRIGEVRRALREYSRNAIQWMDLAYLYSSNGQMGKAKRAVQAATGLAPNNRFVLRSAARFYVHAGDLDQAHRLVRRAPNLGKDPWLASAELAIAHAAGRTPFAMNEARTLLKSQHFSANDLTELSSALATVELKAGSVSKAKRLSKQALLQPNENSLAQVKWLATGIGGDSLSFRVAQLLVPRSFEAAAREAFDEAKWDDAYKASLAWLRDQPFSRGPAHFASFVSGGLLDDHEAAIQIAQLGLGANPQDSVLHANLAFDLASVGRVVEAKAELGKVRLEGSPAWMETAVAADHGLISFRVGDAELGRSFYRRAVELASLLPERQTLFGALVYWAREEIRLTDPAADTLIRRAEEVEKSDPSVFSPYLMQKLHRERSEMAAKGKRSTPK